MWQPHVTAAFDADVRAGFRGSACSPSARTGACAGAWYNGCNPGGPSPYGVGCGVGVATFVRGRFLAGPAPLACECGGGVRGWWCVGVGVANVEVVGSWGSGHREGV